MEGTGKLAFNDVRSDTVDFLIFLVSLRKHGVLTPHVPFDAQVVEDIYLPAYFIICLWGMSFFGMASLDAISRH